MQPWNERFFTSSSLAGSNAVESGHSHARLVHIAAHSTHAPANAQSSRLELADGGLLADELARLHQRPEHVVLARLNWR